MQSASAPRYQLKQFKYNSHYWILKFLREAKRPLRVLDVGTADGYMGATLKEQGHYLVGIEKDPFLAQRAQGFYDHFHLADVETFEFPYHGEFDFVLFADLLEHLRDPASVLQRSLTCLNPQGQVIISLPNVANVVIRMMLLFGRFEYTDRGILDGSHLRFYTLASLKRMVQAASCRVVQVVPTPLPVQLALPFTDRAMFAAFHELHFLAVRSWKTLLAYQFVLRVGPARDCY